MSAPLRPDGQPDLPEVSPASPLQSTDNSYVTPPWERMWFDPECAEDGCQSLIWKSRYESAVRGRQDFRNAYREQLERTKALFEAVRAAQALATACMATGCYSHEELTAMARATKPTFDAAIARAEPQP